MTKIVPRFVLELHPQQHMELLTDAKPEIIKMLARECRQQKYDGMVLCLSLHASYGHK